MKKVNKGPEPARLIEYRTQNTAGTWDNCKRNRNRLGDIQEQIKLDQGGLYAYCEITLRSRRDDSAADFRVEHFHPKSDQNNNHNWHLDWQNLLGCCHGGSRSDVPDRHTSDHSCDVPKENKNLDDVIFNPLRLPKSRIFLFSRADGSIKVDRAGCRNASE